MHGLSYLFFIITIFFLSCEPLQLNTEDIKIERLPYYDVKGLINHQVAYLSEKSPAVQVTATVNGAHQEERKIEKSDSVFWARTLSLVNKADINRPALRGAYTEVDSAINTSLNLMIKSFFPKDDEDMNVLYLNVYYDSTLSTIKYLETVVRDENLLYLTERKMKLTFDNFQGQNRITAYEVWGKQKIIFGDTVRFSTVIKPSFQN